MKILTAYFSHAGENYFDGKIIAVKEGNTAIVAKKIAAMTGSDVFEIARETPYPYSYAECVKEAKEEFIRNSRPELKESVSVKGYDAVILAYPNWCGTMPMAVFTFLESGDFAGKKILPLCTNEGSRLGRSEGDVKKLCPEAEIADGLSVKGSLAAESDEKVYAWLKANGIPCKK